MKTSTMDIGGRKVGKGQKPFIIAEVAQAHDGSLGIAHAFIDLAAASGADAIKFQTHIASAESTLDEKFRVPLSGQDATRYDYWKRMEFTADQWAALSAHARDKGLVFLSSAFSVEAVALLDKIGMAAWKVGSGEFRSQDLLAAMMKTKKPVLLSTGMSTYGEINDAVLTFDAQNVPYGIFQCTSRYPSKYEEVGLNVIGELQEKYGCPAGLSDHCGNPYPSMAALARGADMIEVHLTFHKNMYGPDVPASVTAEELAMICQMRDALVAMDAHLVDKDKAAGDMAEMRKLFTKSIAPTQALKAGTVITEAMLTPAQAGHRHSVHGKRKSNRSKAGARRFARQAFRLERSGEKHA